MARVIEAGDSRSIYRDGDVWVRYPGSNYNSVQPAVVEPVGSGFRGGLGLLAVVFLLLLLFWSRNPGVFRNVDATVSPLNSVVLEPVADVKYVVADNLNMRQRPREDSQISYVLPRGTEVSLLGERSEEIDGDVWVRVRVTTIEGPKFGWVHRNFIA